ncbi:MAG: Autoinducer 2 import system permease protein LsrD [Paracidovorax wautersii]|uniref:Autoinducer 2 import system permease protein LsrD n=1 Tax=Paracidovorax wautersii TaxID=1177982 RepID=A0A7V8JPS0_9BURK|nr:MAG: Autoinducer 2 import system permease protein LsrD [Paracidovorax wautersii]
MSSSIKATALEPDPSFDSQRQGLLASVSQLIPVYGLPVLALALILLFSVLLPDSFPTLFNLRSILSDKSVIAILALAATIPMMTGKIDLTVGYGIVLWHILAISLQTQFGLSWPAAVVVVLLCGALFGLLNGILVEQAQIDSFIATLGTGTVLYAVALWHSGGRQVLGDLPDGFLNLAGADFLGLPITAFYVLGIAVALWLVSEHTPIGRALYVIGSNPKAAVLNGIPLQKCVMGAFVASGTLSAFAGVVLASRLQIGQAGVGLEFLLPALVGAFLGSTTIRPGRVNVWGTLVGVAILAIGISGIQQFGGAFFVEPLFNGLTLLVSIGIAGYAQRKRGLSIKRRIAELHMATTPNAPSTDAAPARVHPH